MDKEKAPYSGKCLSELSDGEKSNLGERMLHTLMELYAQQRGVKIEYEDEKEG